MIFRKPIVLVLVCDGFMNMSMRWLYGALKRTGRPVKVIRFGTMQPFERTTDYSLLQAEGLKLALAIPPPTEDDIRQFRETIAPLDPLWIGFHVLNPTNHVAARLCREARSVCRAPIIWGGAAAIGTPEACLQHADLVCTGEGEPVVVELTSRLSSWFGSDITDIPGTWSRDQAGTIRKNPPQPYLTDEELSRAPHKEFENTDDEILIPANLRDRLSNGLECVDGRAFNSARNVHNVMFSRGCYFSCSFCWRSREVQDRKRAGKAYRLMSPRRAVDLCVKAVDQGKQRIDCWDEIFPNDPDWVRQFTVDYRKRVGLPFSGIFHAKLTDPENVDRLIDAGLDACCIGMQSASARVRKEVFHRIETDEDFLHFAERFASKLHMVFEIITDNPYETPGDLREGIDLMLRMPRPFNIDANCLMFLERHALTERALADGIIGPEHIVGRVPREGVTDLATRSLLPPEGPEKRALAMLLIATSYSWLDPEKVRRWAEDQRHREDDLDVSVMLLQELYNRNRREMYEEETRMVHAWQALQPAAT
jgi:anaerobic magnesium-protoporphyrin IX monomethyl ester cyclase